MAKGFDGAGFLVGGLIGGQLNNAAEASSLRAELSDNLQNLEEYRQRVDEWMASGRNMMRAHIRFKADYEGMRDIIKELLRAIREADPNNQMLHARNRDAIYGEAERNAGDENENSLFSPQIATRTGMLAVIEGCVRELAKLNPGHGLISTDERFAIYWVAFQEECDKRIVSPNQILSWASDKDRCEKWMEKGREYYGQVAAAAARRSGGV